MRLVRLLLVIAACLAARCGSLTGPTNTGLTGTVRRGPITPVCQISTTCDEPFSATFTVRQGDRSVTTFRSDDQGRFESHVPPGNYLVVPASDAPIVSPAAQAKPVEVGTSGLTSVVLEFDTGIR